MTTNWYLYSFFIYNIFCMKRIYVRLWGNHNNNRVLITFLFKHPSILNIGWNQHPFLFTFQEFLATHIHSTICFVWIYDHIYGNSLYVKIGVNSGWISFIHVLYSRLNIEFFPRMWYPKHHLTKKITILIFNYII